MTHRKRNTTKDPFATNNEVENVKLFEILIQLNTSSNYAWVNFPMVKAMALPLLIKDVATTREFVWAPSSGILANELGGNNGDDEDGYRPYTIDLDMEKGFGNSEDASIGATNEFDCIN
ncbi:hypothetical protein V6N13_000956 [Hibiscus sabdariffa]|uniref:Uncharacterized protein n=1 Tax=Hibiscus sabdariffa TaxID=183260 RepID=A0ABR2G7M6_9ROSI